MSRRRFTLLDVFTAERLTGNGLAVVHDADGLDDATMLAFAREMRLSESSFVQSPRAGGDYRHRIFMPTGEIPFAGHPSLGTAIAVARARGDRAATYVQETRAGEQPIDVEVDGDRARASMLQEPAVLGDAPDAGEVLRAAGLDAGRVAPRLPPRFVSTGAWQLIAGVDDPAALDAARPDYDAIAALLEPAGAITLYLAHVDAGSRQAVARSFTGSAQVGEDPATGSAAGPLQAYAAEALGVTALEIFQGERMGRRSVLRTAVEGDRVRVGGDAVVVVDGEVVLDA